MVLIKLFGFRLVFTFVLFVSANQTTAQSCRFYDDQFFGYSCELNNALVTSRDQILQVITDNHLAGRNDSSVRHFTLNSNTTTLTFFPNSLFSQFPNMRYLLIDRSGLTELAPFTNCGNVVIMHIRYSTIERVPAGIFDACTNLVVLDLSDNHISEIDDDAFANLSQLLELDINHNRLVRISNRWFRNLENLEDLNIRYNLIEEIEDGAFSGLTNLITFYLRNNRISEIRPEMFGDEISLVFFNVNENRLARVPQLPSRAPRLKYIHVAKNSIYNIYEGDFSFAYSNITNIDLSENLLQSLSAAPFEVLQRLDILLVNNNEIRAIDFELFDRVPSLYTFYFLQNDCADIRFDNIRSIDQDDAIAAAFESCYFHFFTPETNVTCNFVRSESSYVCMLNEITFQNFRDKFNIVGAHIDGLVNEDVTELQISRSNLFRVPPTLFETFQNLERVSIIDSGLTVIEKGTFEECGKITYLDLSRNRIRRLSTNSFKNCEFIDELILDENQITEIAPCNSFLLNIYQTTKLSLLNNVCISQSWDTSPDWLAYSFEETIYPYLNRCFSLWYMFLDSSSRLQ